MKTSNEKTSIIIVDDDEMHNKAFENQLQDHAINMTIKTFVSGESFLINAENGSKPDIVILDYNLDSVNKNAMNGIQVLKQLMKTNPEVEVIMLSNQEKLEVAKNTIKYGAYDYVVKGESAFIRTKMLIDRIIRARNLKSEYIEYKKASRLLATIILLTIIATGVLHYYKPDLFTF